MPLQQPQWTDFLSCTNCSNDFSIASNKHPVTLLCGHTICKECVHKSRGCNFDQGTGSFDLSILGVNHPILHLVKYQSGSSESGVRACEPRELIAILGQNYSYYKTAMQHMEGIGLYLRDIKGGIIKQDSELTKPMLRKVVNLVQCQLALEDGRLRLLRACRALGERSATELILAHQNPATLSGHLWTAIRARGCQFLGPAMQEEALKLILLALEDGSELSRKVLVMFVVQKLQQQYQQSSKTSIGHVVQLLYRASCFVVTKRDGDSSLMRLKECYRTYPALRKEHDTQIVQIAREAGLRIAPDQWSSLLYGDQDQKSHMQSVIDRLQSKESFERCIQELQALVKSNDSSKLSNLIPHFEILSQIDSDGASSSSSRQNEQKQDWNLVITCLQSVKFIIQELVSFSKTWIKDLWQEEEAMAQSAKYKTSFCRDVKNKGRCPRGDSCTFAHTEEELHWHRSKRKKGGLGPTVREKPVHNAQKSHTTGREGSVNNFARVLESKSTERPLNQVPPIQSETAAPSSFMPPRFPPPGNYPSFMYMPPNPYPPHPVPPHNYGQSLTMPEPPYNTYRSGEPQINYHTSNPHHIPQGIAARPASTSTAPVSSSTRPVHPLQSHTPQSSTIPEQRTCATTPTNMPLPHFTLTVSIQSDQHDPPGNPHHIRTQVPTDRSTFAMTPNNQEHQSNQSLPNVRSVKDADLPAQDSDKIMDNPAHNPPVVQTPSQVMFHPMNQGSRYPEYPMQYIHKVPNLMEENSFYPNNMKQQVGGQSSAPRDGILSVIEPNLPIIVPVENPILRTPTPNFPTHEKQVAIVSPQPIVQQSLPPPHLYDANNGIMYHSPPGQYQPTNTVNPIVVAPSPTPMLQSPNVLMMQIPTTQPYPIVDPQQILSIPIQTQWHCARVHCEEVLPTTENPLSHSPAPSAGFLQNISIPTSINEATVEQLERRKGKIIHQLIQNQRVEAMQPSQVDARKPAPESGKLYDVWNSETCASFFLRKSLPASSLNYPEENSMSDEFQTNVVDVIADIDTRTTQVTVRGTDHINPSHSLKERTLDDSRMHKLLVKMNTDLKNTEATNKPSQPLSALIQYSSSSQEEEDEMIPFSDRPIVSKYGPIARSVRTRPSNTELVQVNSNNDVLTHPVAAASENPTTESSDAYPSFESPSSVSYFQASFPRSRETLSVQSSKNHPKIPASNMMPSNKITPVQAASNSKLLHREEAAIQQNQSIDFPEDLKLVTELQQIEIRIHQKRQKKQS